MDGTTSTVGVNKMKYLHWPNEQNKNKYYIISDWSTTYMWLLVLVHKKTLMISVWTGSQNFLVIINIPL